MPIFSNYMAALAARRNLRRSLDGAMVRYQFSLPKGSLIEVLCHELDPNHPPVVQSEPWAGPLNLTEHANFMRTGLKNNRSALHHIPAGLVIDPDNSAVYRLMWFVSRQDLPDIEWHRGLLEFDALHHAYDKNLRSVDSMLEGRGSNNTVAAGQYQIFMP